MAAEIIFRFATCTQPVFADGRRWHEIFLCLCSWINHDAFCFGDDEGGKIDTIPAPQRPTCILPVMYLDGYDRADDCKTNDILIKSSLHVNVSAFLGRKGPEESRPCDDFLDSYSSSVPGHNVIRIIRCRSRFGD